MNAEAEEARPLANVGTGAIQERVVNSVCAGELKKVPVCSTCGKDLEYGHFDPWGMKHYWWCRNFDCEDHTAPVVIPV